MPSYFCLQGPMAYCCVPRCRSDAKKKVPGVSFHEIPADEVLRRQWLRAIHRDDWLPNTTSNYSRVCSRHFRDTDFAEGKRRRLKKGVVPFVLLEYPTYMRPQPLKERETNGIRKRTEVHALDKEPAAKRRKHDENDTPEIDEHFAEPSPEQADSTPQVTAYVEESLGTAPRVQTNISHKAVQMDARLPSILAVERAKWRCKERDMKKQLERLRQTVDSYK
ncbi:hypothetical protein HPB48_010623 [Haemaphysalis longicornis]|uniref:THAP-type domain-containing protein n=1 Tax=Haemaphysalis longicornis TaxID=44386 RepID=A0A9J6G1D9_HAELO|nr:hypothetical protein HPB48_010623 [Haemaphysalis longicornis]